MNAEHPICNAVFPVLIAVAVAAGISCSRPPSSLWSRDASTGATGDTSCDKSCDTTCDTNCDTKCDTSCDTSRDTSCDTSCDTTCDTSCDTMCDTTCDTSSDDAPGFSTTHIILFIGDGMPLLDEIAASRYLFGHDRGLAFHSFEYSGYVSTWNVTSYNEAAQSIGASAYDPASFDPSIGYDANQGGDRPYPLCRTDDQDGYFLGRSATDSAAAMSAIMTGAKTSSGNISWLWDDRANGAIETIAEKLRGQRGFAVGEATTVKFNDATPAAVFAHNVSRSNYSLDIKNAGFDGTPIAEEIVLQEKPDVVIGAGHPNWIDGYMTDILYNSLKGSDEYVFAERIAGASGQTAISDGAQDAVLQGKKLWGLFGGSSGEFEAEIPSDSPGSPGFTKNSENPTLAQAVSAALEVMSKDTDGLFAVFEQGDIDHANHANSYSWMIGGMNDLNDAVIAAVDFVNRPGDDLDWDNTLIVVTADHCNGYMRLAVDKPLGKGDLPIQTPKAIGNGYDYSDQEVTWGTTGHTNELVSIYAKGAGVDLFKKREGSWYPGTRIIDNTQIFEVFKELTGVK